MNDDMQPGREMDALIAEIRGWTKTVSADHRDSTIPFLREMKILYRWKDPLGKDYGLDLPCFSTNIAIAMQLFDEQGGWLLYHYRYNGVDYWVIYDGIDVIQFDDDDGLSVSRTSASHAICLAIIADHENKNAHKCAKTIGNL